MYNSHVLNMNSPSNNWIAVILNAYPNKRSTIAWQILIYSTVQPDRSQLLYHGRLWRQGHSVKDQWPDPSTSENALAALQRKLTKFMKRWLNLPRCCTLATVYHPEVLDLPFLPHCRKQAKLSMVGALEFSSDPTIKECLTQGSRIFKTVGHT